MAATVACVAARARDRIEVLDVRPGGTCGDVAWVWVLVAGIGVGLPAVAWWLSRGARSVPLSVPGRRADPIDRWLFDRYGLGVLDRWQVREALAQGRRPGQPLLGEAADGLAAEVLSGRLHGPRAWRWLGWCFVSYGICFCIAGIVGHGLIGRVAYFLGGPVWRWLASCTSSLCPGNYAARPVWHFKNQERSSRVRHRSLVIFANCVLFGQRRGCFGRSFGLGCSACPGR
jgi:hypothetical protein